MNPLLLSLVGVCILARPGAPADLPACAVLNEASRGRLGDYVRKKFNLLASTQIVVRDLGVVGETCYRKLEFSSVNSPRVFRAELIASPDLRFLTRELLDSQIDPTQEQRQQAKALAEKLASGDAASLGPTDASVTLVLFSDFQCPYCAQMARGLTQEILPKESQKTRVIFRNFPLPMHPWARSAAEVAACARSQGDEYFWPLHDYIFSHQREITIGNVKAKLTEQLRALSGFDESRFRACQDSGEMAAKVERDIAFGKELQVNATPTLFINGQRVSGYRPEEIRTLIREQAGSQ